MTEETSITTLIRGLKQGDHAAVEQLWIRYFDRLVALARQKLSWARKRSYDEEDVAISVFDSLCRGAERGHFKTLSDREDLWALLLALTRQKAVDRIRYENRAKRGGGRVRGESVFDAGTSADHGLEKLVAKEPDPKFLVSLQEQHERLLEMLPDDYRRVVRLRMEGYTVKEIGEEFGYTTRWAERKLQIVRRKWLHELGGHDDAP